MKSDRRWTEFLSVVFATALLSSSVQSAELLISTEEAQLPPPKGAVAVSARGITRGPKIELSDEDMGLLKSPMNLKIKSQTFGGATIDLNALRVTYLRTPNVDLTPRVKPFAQSTGIEMLSADLPAGEHILRVDIKDSDGRAASTSFVLKIAP